MQGKELYDLLKSKRISHQFVGEKLGMTSQAFGSKLRVQYLKPEFIQQVSEAVGFDVENPNPAPSMPAGYISENTHKAIVEGLLEELREQRKEMARLRQELDSLRNGATLKKDAV